MIPLRDEIPTHRTPLVTYVLIALNVLVFIFQYLFSAGDPELVYSFAMVPALVTGNFGLWPYLTIFTSMFMHGGLAHIGGNMLYLWIFGDNVEDAMGSGKYLFFYLLGGTLASLAHILTSPNSQVPTVGASGAIAAVLGAYLVLYPQSRVVTLIPLGFFMRVTLLPAVLVLGLWFVLQFFQGLLSLGGPDVGGVAFWAHIGGFAVGALLAKLFATRRSQQYAQRW